MRREGSKPHTGNQPMQVKVIPGFFKSQTDFMVSAIRAITKINYVNFEDIFIKKLFKLFQLIYFTKITVN